MRITRRKAITLTILVAVLLVAPFLFVRLAPSAEGYTNPQALASPSWLHQHLSDSTIRVFEVGTDPSDFRVAHIPGSLFIAYDSLTDPTHPIPGMIPTGTQLETLMSNLGVWPNHTVVFYDRLGGLFATWAFYLMDHYGQDEVKVLNGGWEAWIVTGGETSQGQPHIAPSTYAVSQIRTGYRSDATFILQILDDPEFVILDTRSYEEHTGEVNRSARGGRIPGAVHTEWSESTHSNSTFRSASDLRQLYESSGVARDMSVVVYCQLGVRGSHTWFVLKHLLGYPRVRLYDGSWEEWGNDPQLPIETG